MAAAKKAPAKRAPTKRRVVKTPVGLSAFQSATRETFDTDIPGVGVVRVAEYTVEGIDSVSELEGVDALAAMMYDCIVDSNDEPVFESAEQGKEVLNKLPASASRAISEAINTFFPDDLPEGN